MGGVGIVFNLITKEFGYNTLQTTALSIPIGAAPVIAISILTILIKYFPNSRCILAIWAWILPSICCFLLIFLPWGNKTGLLVAFYLLFSYTSGFAMILSLVAVVFAGHTKVTRPSHARFKPRLLTLCVENDLQRHLSSRILNRWVLEYMVAYAGILRTYAD